MDNQQQIMDFHDILIEYLEQKEFCVIYMPTVERHAVPWIENDVLRSEISWQLMGLDQMCANSSASFGIMWFFLCWWCVGLVRGCMENLSMPMLFDKDGHIPPPVNVNEVVREEWFQQQVLDAEKREAALLRGYGIWWGNFKNLLCWLLLLLFALTTLE